MDEMINVWCGGIIRLFRMLNRVNACMSCIFCFFLQRNVLYAMPFFNGKISVNTSSSPETHLFSSSKWQRPYNVIKRRPRTSTSESQKIVRKKICAANQKVRIFAVQSALHSRTTIEFRIPFSVDVFSSWTYYYVNPHTSSVRLKNCILFIFPPTKAAVLNNTQAAHGPSQHSKTAS